MIINFNVSNRTNSDVLLYIHSGSALGGPGTQKNLIIAVLCKTCCMLLCVLEQSRVGNSSLGPLKRGDQLGAIGPICLRSTLCPLV